MQPMLTQHRELKTAEIQPLDENANPDYTLAVPDDSISNIQHYDKICVLVFQQTTNPVILPQSECLRPC